MPKKKVELSEEQMQRNASIMQRIEMEKRRLLEETRALQEEWSSKKRRRRRRSALEG